jgi:hypothetical protein
VFHSFYSLFDPLHTCTRSMLLDIWGQALFLHGLMSIAPLFLSGTNTGSILYIPCAETCFIYSPGEH